ncbi:MAG TPA: FHA domain-containing protein [Candidatus Polarisedimenticolia bacterium]|jgi:pSer/pThr/pTyr-binding forkhead associated (FHA) protein
MTRQQSQPALACAVCGGALKVDERASQRAARLIYACGPCGRYFSTSEQRDRLVEERSISDTASRTVRMRAVSKGAPAAGRSDAETTELPVGMSVALEVTDGPMRGKTFRLSRRVVVVGREEAGITIPDPMISRSHASLEVLDVDTIILRDLSSTNGTYHNDHLIAFSKIQDGDEIRIGSTTMTVSVDVLG